jgi:hypothetical protein
MTLAILTGSEAVDALFVDIILNGDMQAGIELAKRAVELKPGLRVVYSTGLTVTDGMKALLVPGSAILEKPYTVDQLLMSLSVHGTFERSHDDRTASAALYPLARYIAAMTNEFGLVLDSASVRRPVVEGSGFVMGASDEPPQPRPAARALQATHDANRWRSDQLASAGPHRGSKGGISIFRREVAWHIEPASSRS